jgi:hypothetical protein
VEQVITPEEGVKAYHNTLRNLGIKPSREIADDMQLTEAAFRYQ